MPSRVLAETYLPLPGQSIDNVDISESLFSRLSREAIESNMVIAGMETASKPDTRKTGKQTAHYFCNMDKAMPATRFDAPELPSFSLAVNNSFFS